MALLPGGCLNMDSSDDPNFRYQMPALRIKHEGSTKMKKTVILNLTDVSRAVGRPPEQLLTHMGQTVKVSSKMEEGMGRAYLSGHHELQVLQKSVYEFIRDTVMCGHCRNPETVCGVEGKKNKLTVFLTCKGCGNRTDLDSTKKIVKSMAQQLQSSYVQDQAQAIVGTMASSMADVTMLAEADAEKKKEKKTKKKAHAERTDEEGKKGEKKGKKKDKVKHKCPNPECGHNTSKAVCSKCGTIIAGESDSSDLPEAELPGHREVHRAHHCQQHGAQHEE